MASRTKSDRDISMVQFIDGESRKPIFEIDMPSMLTAYEGNYQHSIVWVVLPVDVLDQTPGTEVGGFVMTWDRLRASTFENCSVTPFRWRDADRVLKVITSALLP